MPTTIRFTATLSTVESSTIVRLPVQASQQLPSRGQVAVTATIGDQRFRTVVEPDGMRGHWLKLNDGVVRAGGIGAGDSVDVTLEVAQDWPEPEVPPDLAAALESASPK